MGSNACCWLKYQDPTVSDTGITATSGVHMAGMLVFLKVQRWGAL